jgi:hypothetical protein
VAGEAFDIVRTREVREYTYLTGIEGRVGLVEGCFAVQGVIIIFPKGSADLAADRRSVLCRGTRYAVGNYASFVGAPVRSKGVPDVVLPKQFTDSHWYFLAG